MDLKAFILGVVSSLVSAIILAIFLRFKTGIDFSSALIKYVIQLYKRLSGVGFSNFYASRADYIRFRGAARLGDYLSFAQQKIVLIGLWMAHGVEIEGVINHIKNLIEQRPALHIGIALLDPDAVVLDSLGQYLNINADEIKTRINMAFGKLIEMKETLSENDKLRIDLRTYNSLPTFSSILIDPDADSCRIQIDIKVYQEARHNSFSLEFKGHGKYMYELLANAAQRQFYNAIHFDSRRLDHPNNLE